MKFKRDQGKAWWGALASVAALCAVGLLLIVSVGAVLQTEPTLTSDKEDYAPGEVAILTGSGFLPGECVDISISIDDPATGLHIGDYVWTQCEADEHGGFVAYFTVPEEAAGMVLTATAMGITSSRVATVSFTDTHYTLVYADIAVTGNNTVGWTVTVTVIIGGGGPLPAGVTANVVVTAGPALPGFDLPLDLDSTDPITGTSTWKKSRTLTGPEGCGRTYKLQQVKVAKPSGQGGPSGHGGPDEKTFPVNREASSGPCEPLPNRPPVITCLDPEAKLGKVIGCLGEGTGFGKAFPVTYTAVGAGNSWTVKATFDLDPVGPGNEDVTVDVATVFDPDGDTVTVTLTDGIDPVIISGPGEGSAGFSVKITAFDGIATVGPTICAGTAKAQIVYAGVGGTGSPTFGQPMQATKALIVRRGSGFPVKFRLYDCNGIEICTDLGAGPHVIDVVFLSGAVPASDPDVTDAGTANSNDVYFRYSGTCGVDGNWIYNLKTTNQYSLNATYKVIAYLNDGTKIEGLISIK